MTTRRRRGPRPKRVAPRRNARRASGHVGTPTRKQLRTVLRPSASASAWLGSANVPNAIVSGKRRSVPASMPSRKRLRTAPTRNGSANEPNGSVSVPRHRRAPKKLVASVSMPIGPSASGRQTNARRRLVPTRRGRRKSAVGRKRPPRSAPRTHAAPRKTAAATNKPSMPNGSEHSARHSDASTSCRRPSGSASSVAPSRKLASERPSSAPPRPTPGVVSRKQPRPGQPSSGCRPNAPKPNVDAARNRKLGWSATVSSVSTPSVPGVSGSSRSLRQMPSAGLAIRRLHGARPTTAARRTPGPRRSAVESRRKKRKHDARRAPATRHRKDEVAVGRDERLAGSG